MFQGFQHNNAVMFEGFLKCPHWDPWWRQAFGLVYMPHRCRNLGKIKLQQLWKTKQWKIVYNFQANRNSIPNVKPVCNIIYKCRLFHDSEFWHHSTVEISQKKAQPETNSYSLSIYTFGKEIFSAFWWYECSIFKCWGKFSSDKKM